MVKLYLWDWRLEGKGVNEYITLGRRLYFFASLRRRKFSIWKWKSMLDADDKEFLLKTAE